MNHAEWRVLVTAHIVRNAHSQTASCIVSVDPANLVALTLVQSTVGLASSHARLLASLLTTPRSGTVTTLCANEDLVSQLTVTPGATLTHPARRPTGLIALDTLDTAHPVALLLEPEAATTMARALRTAASRLEGRVGAR
ncbi:hypothetical protein C1701_21145 [Actinoalloteichus sp. AHMU CJ021]|nr:hypothetical protein C1701_21145 [Actinoalloteichus sp. AHMU CJ021]